MERTKPNELETRVDEVLFYLWDPIGVNNEPYARAEYRAYVAEVLDQLENNNTASEIAACLCAIVSGSMELVPDKENALKVARVLLEHKCAIDQGCA